MENNETFIKKGDTCKSKGNMVIKKSNLAHCSILLKFSYSFLLHSQHNYILAPYTNLKNMQNQGCQNTKTRVGFLESRAKPHWAKPHSDQTPSGKTPLRHNPTHLY